MTEGAVVHAPAAARATARATRGVGVSVGVGMGVSVGVGVGVCMRALVARRAVWVVGVGTQRGSVVGTDTTTHGRRRCRSQWDLRHRNTEGKRIRCVVVGRVWGVLRGGTTTCSPVLMRPAGCGL